MQEQPNKTPAEAAKPFTAAKPLKTDASPSTRSLVLDDGPLSIWLFSQAQDEALTRAVQQLRYDIYHHDMGLDTPDMDHARRLDIEDNDPISDCLVAMDGEQIVGCMRLQTSGTGDFYAEKEFVLQGPSWQQHPLVEGARFAIRSEYRDGRVPLLLFSAFRRYCKQRNIRHLLSVSIVSDPQRRDTFALRIFRYLQERTHLALERGRPAPGYEHPLDLAHAAELSPIDQDALPPMARMLANRRTTLCSAPAYCRRFNTWNFLLVTELRGRTKERA